MSFDNPSPFAQWQSSLAPSSENRNHNRLDRPTQSPWGQRYNPPSNRPGLAPLATSNLGGTSASDARRFTQQAESGPQNITTSPSNANFPPLLPASANRFGSRRPTPPTSSHSNSPLHILQSGASQQSGPFSGRSITSPRSRTITPLQQPFSGAGTYQYQGLGAGGGGGGGYNSSARSGAYSPSFSGPVTSPTTFNFERSSSISSNPSSATGTQSSFSKISATQVLLLVDTITERKGRAEWEAKAEKIRKLVESNGMEVFTQFFRRVVSSNAPAIFSGTRDFDQGSYKLLQQELDKVPQDPEQASKIAEAIDASKDDIFRDFDLATFISHFYSDAVPQTLLAITFTRCNRSDLRNKAEKFLSTILTSAVQVFAEGRVPLQRYHPKNVAALIEYICFTPSLASASSRYDFYWRLRTQYGNQGLEVPAEVTSALMLLRLPAENQNLVKTLMRSGGKSTSSKQAVEDVLHAIGLNNIDDSELAHAILFMLFARSQPYDLSTFISTVKVKTHHMRVDWTGVLSELDVPGIRVQENDFLRLFRALHQVAVEDPSCDLQKLWGGKWQDPQTQASFLYAFLMNSTVDVGPKQIPGFRSAIPPDDLEKLPADGRQYVESQMNTPFSSADALLAVFDILVAPEFPADEPEKGKVLREIFENHSAVFLLSLQKLKAKPWSPTQEQFVHTCFRQFLEKQRDNYSIVLKALFAQSHQFLFDLCAITFQQDPTQTENIYERASEFEWMDEFLKHWSNPLALDMACMRSKLESTFDLDRYLSDIAEGHATQLGVILCKYVRIKADDEYRVQKELIEPQSIPLTLSSVHTLLDKLEELTSDRELVESAQTTCLQTYPRLMNFGAGYDEILERSSEEKGNKLPESIDAQMSDLFGRMYRSELSIRDMVREMTTLKTSQDPEQQDLFCCIVHGLFDEYVCYAEYPEDALMKTALLFGSIIKFKLLPNIPRDFGLVLIFRAVRDNPPDTLMYRFGIEALLQISEQLPEWPGLCNLLLQIPTLQDPEIIQRAQDGLRNQQTDHPVNGNGRFHTTNGDSTDFLRQENVQNAFKSIRADPPPNNTRFADPEQQAQEKILFVINNLSKDNMSSKFAEIRASLSTEHYQWFACYLVEQRAKLEPNNQDMYLNFAIMMDDDFLMSELIRETFVSVVKLINSDSTLNSANSTERNQLKSLGSWLGALTLAQDKPIKHKNIYFVDFLIEGLETQRLLIVIPFTCKVLAQSAKSLIFKEHNPWLMEIAEVLKELYDSYDLKLSLKFEIEVLFNEHLKLNLKKMPISNLVRDRSQAEDGLTTLAGLPDGLETFDDLSLNGAIGRAGRERISASEIMSTLPNLAEVLKYPPPSGSPSDQALVRETVYRAFDQAIQEIIAPVVERSITIASIATQQLISKDYAQDKNADNILSGAREMVKSLAGSLALVTCKEPLKMSIQNWLRRPPEEMHDAVMPEGAIVMCVNDNLDMACSFVEQAAVQRSMPEIENVIEAEIEERRRYAAEGNTNPFVSSSSNINRWSGWIPEPYKQNMGGLNESQRAVYEDFERRVHGTNIGHAQNLSTDSTGRQIPDVLQEALAMPNLSTPADTHVIPHQSPLVQHDARMLSAATQGRMNGVSDSMPPQERIAVLIEDVQKATRVSDAKRLKEVEKNSSIFQDFRQILIILTSSTRPTSDLLARQVAEKICNIFATKPPQDSLEAEWLAFLLSKLCQLSELIIRDVLRWMTANEHLLLNNSNVVAALVIVGLMDFTRVDAAVASALANRDQQGLRLLSDLMDQTLFIDEPQALRADFANSLVEMSRWLAEDPGLEPAKDINQKLKAHGMPEFVSAAVTDKSKAKLDQMRYINDEWLSMFENLNPDSSSTAAFLKDMHKNQIINGTEDLAEFLRLAMETCVESFEREAQSIRGSIDNAFLPTDALAKLLINLVVFQGGTNGAVQLSKAPYLETILSVLVLIANHHQVMHGIAFHQRVFARLISSMLYAYAESGLQATPEHNSFVLAFGNLLKSVQPAWFPTFTFAWVGLITHRVLTSGMLGHNNEAGALIYRELVGLSLLYLAQTSNVPNVDSVVIELHRGIIRNILVLHHDYPEFLCTNYAYLCSRVPYYMPQLRNLILTSRPAAYQDLPDPMTPGLRVERLEEMKKNPELASDFDTPLQQYGLAESINAAFRKGGDIDTAIRDISTTLQDEKRSSPSSPTKSINILNSIVPYITVQAVAQSPIFDASSLHANFLVDLATILNFEHRYYFLNALFDQIRYPNTHTDYFCKFILSLWGKANDQGEIKEQICRVVYERLAVARPHPWGIAILCLELQQNQSYGFWDFVGSGKDDGQQAIFHRLQQAMRQGFGQ